ncbi:uncharacterized protein LOC134719709 [Mytilus trossulus]|uniref:uncharacterized protein LOC134711931 n=1 Tax=Mytilus trossulus TaxID=6551 RepID=UPI003005B86F
MDLPSICLTVLMDGFPFQLEDICLMDKPSIFFPSVLENSSIHLTQIQQLEMNTERIIKIEWSIKGYHAFRIKPHSQIELDVLPEEGNPFSQYATKVVMPLLQEISPDLHNVSTDMREENHQRGQLMKDIAGKQVGRVPANLCTAFRNMISRNTIRCIKCKVTGPPRLSANPPSNQRYRSNNRGHDRPGGGADIPCSYYLHIRDRMFADTMHILEDCVPLRELDERVHA